MADQLWQPIETAPERTKILVCYCYGDGSHEIDIDTFEWSKRCNRKIESESHNATGRRLIIQESYERVRSWDKGSMPDWWMPLPGPPPATRESSPQITAGMSDDGIG